VTIGTVANGTIAAGASESFEVATGTGIAMVSVVGKAGDSATTQLAELNSALGAYGISASLDTSGKLAFSSSGAFSITSLDAGLAGAGDTGTNTALNNGSLTYGQAASVYTVTEGTTTATLHVAAGLSDPDALASINAQLNTQGIHDVTAVASLTAPGAYSLQSASTFTDALVSGVGAAVGGVVAAAGGGNGALNAINAITAAVQALGSVQGKVGAGENDLNYGISLANSQITNLSSAESAIRDADVAKEAANLTKAQVLEQASVAAMAQANQTPQALLALLKS
jgi:flagellin